MRKVHRMIKTKKDRMKEEHEKKIRRKGIKTLIEFRKKSKKVNRVKKKIGRERNRKRLRTKNKHEKKKWEEKQ